MYSRAINSNVEYPANLCGNAFLDSRQELIDVEFDAKHTAEVANLEVSTTLESESKWGIKDMFIYYSPCSAHCKECTGPSAGECSACQSEYSLQDGTCQKMHQFRQFAAEFTTDDFTDLAGWQLANHESNNLLSTCGDKKLVGGYSILGAGSSGRKTYTDLPDHTRLKLTIQLWKIDQWDNQDLILTADNQELYRIKSFWAEGGA